MPDAALGGIVDAPADRTPRLEIPFARLGKWRHPQYKQIELTQDTFDQMRTNFYAGSNGSRPFVRIGHANYDAQPKDVGDTAALAWIDDLVQRGDVMYALANPTSQDAVDRIESGQFRYSSMEFYPNYKPRDWGAEKVGATLSAVALTNEPHLTNLPETRVVLSRDDRPAMAKQFFALDLGAVEDDPMSDADKILEEIRDNQKGFLASISDGLKLMFTAKSDAVPAAAVETDAEKTIAARIAALTADEEAAKASLTATRLLAHTQRVEQVCSKAVADGVPPAIVHATRPLMLAAFDAAKIKVTNAQDQEEEVDALEALAAIFGTVPEASRVKLGQVGSVPSTSKDADRIEAKALALKYKKPGTLVAE